jgi:hypothetical protein
LAFEPLIAAFCEPYGQVHAGPGEGILVFALRRLIALRAAWLVHQLARPTLTHGLFLRMIHRTAPSLRAQKFPAAMSFSTSFSRLSSLTSRFSFVFQSYFASGTQLQEIYITPSLLTRQNWDTLAHAARWARASSAILEDTHWIGGDPGKLQVYGWAAWNPRGWIVTLRNPSDHAQTYSLDLPAALQLPAGTRISYRAFDPFGKTGEARIQLEAVINFRAAGVARENRARRSRARRLWRVHCRGRE